MSKSFTRAAFVIVIVQIIDAYLQHEKVTSCPQVPNNASLSQTMHMCMTVTSIVHTLCRIVEVSAQIYHPILRRHPAMYSSSSQNSEPHHIGSINSCIMY